MNSDDFYREVKKHTVNWLLAYKDSSSVLWAITDVIKRYEQSRNSWVTLENIKTLDEDPHNL